MDRRTRNRLCIWLIILGLSNFIAYAVVYAIIGGDAPNGYIRDGLYYVRGHFVHRTIGYDSDPPAHDGVSAGRREPRTARPEERPHQRHGRSADRVAHDPARRSRNQERACGLGRRVASAPRGRRERDGEASAEPRGPMRHDRTA
jgi:hypothetical protein